MTTQLEARLEKLFTIDQMEKLCVAKELCDRLRTTGISTDENRYLEDLMEELEEVLPH